MLEKLIRQRLEDSTNKCKFKKAFTPKGFAIVCKEIFPKEVAEAFAKELKKKGNSMGEWLKECGY